MRILHLTAPADVGGLERVVHGLAIGHHRRGHDVHVAAVLHTPSSAHPFLAPLRAAGVPVHPVHVLPRAYLQERKIVMDLCKRIEPDVVHTHGTRPDVVGGGVALKLKIPLAATIHGYAHEGFRERMSEWIQQGSLRRFQAVIAVSRPLWDRLSAAGIRRDRLHLVPNGWAQVAEPAPRDEAREALGAPDDAFHLGWVGRLSLEKGPDTFVEALGLLRDVPFVVSILGDGSMARTLQDRVRRLGLEDRVRWHGSVPEASRLFTGFDGLVLSSRTEGTPIVLFEAMTAEVPVVATTVGGVPDVLSPEEAILVPPQDPPALAAAIRRLIQESGEERSRRIQAATDRLADAFAEEAWLDRYTEIYRSIADLPSPVEDASALAAPVALGSPES